MQQHRLTVITLLTVVLLVNSFTSDRVSSQYIEECHYECAVEYCDYYSDYCDYDCYEVCYPYRSLGINNNKLPISRQSAASAAIGQRRGRIHSIDKNQAATTVQSLSSISSKSNNNEQTKSYQQHQQSTRHSLPTPEVGGKFYEETGSMSSAAAAAMLNQRKSPNSQPIRTGNVIQVKIKQIKEQKQQQAPLSDASLPRTFALFKTSPVARNEQIKGVMAV